MTRPLAWIGLTTLALAAPLATIGCEGDDPASVAAGERATLIVGTEASYPPFESINERGEFEGFDVELVRLVAQEIGRDVEFRNLGFDALIPALQSGQIDLAAAAMSITPERQRAVLFSDPYLEAGLVMTVSEGSTIAGVGDLSGQTVAVQQGSTGAGFAEGLRDRGQIAGIKYFETIPLAMMEVRQGGAAAVINDKPTSEAFVAQVPGFRVIDETLQSDPYGLAMRRDNEALAARVNQALADLRSEGRIDELKRKWLAPEAVPAAGEPAPATQPMN